VTTPTRVSGSKRVMLQRYVAITRVAAKLNSNPITDPRCDDSLCSRPRRQRDADLEDYLHEAEVVGLPPKGKRPADLKQCLSAGVSQRVTRIPARAGIHELGEACRLCASTTAGNQRTGRAVAGAHASPVAFPCKPPRHVTCTCTNTPKTLRCQADPHGVSYCFS
jgi:hypothetical protein